MDNKSESDDALPPINSPNNGSFQLAEDYMEEPPPNNPTLIKPTNEMLYCDSVDDYDTPGRNYVTQVDLEKSRLNLGLSDDDDDKHKHNAVKFQNSQPPSSGGTSPQSTQQAQSLFTDGVDIYDGFVLEVYVLDRQGRRLQDARNPDRDPPPLCRLKQGCALEATTISGQKLETKSNINVIDTEIEARLLNLGRPLPSQIALYGWTSWGKTPLQCAVADGTLGEGNVREYVDRFLGDDALPRCSLETMKQRAMDTHKKTSPQGGTPEGTEDAGSGLNTPPTKSFSTSAPTPAASHVPQVDNYNVNYSSADPTEDTEDRDPSDIVDGSSELDYISPQLTSLRTDGHSLTLRELVQYGYLEPIASRHRTSLSDKSCNSGRQDDPDSQRDEVPLNEKLPHRNVFAIEIMFDEMRTGLQRKMPDIRASAPHGEGASVFAITDDVPVDVRVDLINMLKVDLDDAYFEVDFDMTFSWLIRMPPFEVNEKLHREAKAMKQEANVQNNRDTFAASNSFIPTTPGRGLDPGSTNQGSKFKKLWRPQWRFTNRVNDDGDITERVYISERQKMARGMRLSEKVVESYWPYGNPSRDELVETSAQAIRKFQTELDPRFKMKSFYQRKRESSKKDVLSNSSSMSRFKQAEVKSIAESFDILTRRTGGANSKPTKTQDGGGGTFSTPSNLMSVANNSANEGVEGVTEVVLKVASRGLRFSLENQSLENFPFDTLSLPIFIGFREPMGCYQASIARTLKEGDSRKCTTKEFLDAASEADSDSSESGDERAFVSMRNRLSKHVATPFYSLLGSKKSNKITPSSPVESPPDSPRSLGSYEFPAKDMKSDRVHALNRLFGDFENTDLILDQAQKCLRDINETNDTVSLPSFRPAIDFVPIPGRLRLRVSNDYVNTGVAEHRLRSYKWAIEDLYVQKSKGDTKSDAFMQINVRAESVHELQHRWATPVMAIRVHVHRKSTYVLQYIYLPLFLMTFVSLNTILVGYGMDLVSAFGDRCSITLTLLLTVVATELPEHLKEVAQVKDLKGWAFRFIVFIIFKDICATCAWWPTTYWHSQDIAIHNPWVNKEGEESRMSAAGSRMTNGFYSGEEFPWWHRIWLTDAVCTVLCLFVWGHQFLKLCFWPRANWEGQQTAAVVRFEALPDRAQLLGSGCFVRDFIQERAANFLHDRWRAGYSQQCKKQFIAEQRAIQKQAKFQKKSPSSATQLPSIKSILESRKNPFPVTKGCVGVNRKASAIWVNEQLRTGFLEVPPRWKSETTYQNPPTDIKPPEKKYHGGVGSPNRWKHPLSGEWYVNIDQKLSRLPEIAMNDNLASASSVISMLEKTPHAPRTELAYKLHREWVDHQADVPADDKLRNPWADLPRPDKIKNMVIINTVLDMCALAHQVHATVTNLFNKDGDGQVSSDEFLGGEALKPLFHDNIRVPIRKGDIVGVRDLCRNSDITKQAVVIGWQQRSHWNHAKYNSKRRSSLTVVKDQHKKNHNYDQNNKAGEMKSDNEDSMKFNEEDTFVDTIEGDVEADEFQFHGTVFFVRFIKGEDRKNFTSGILLPLPQSARLNNLLQQQEIHAIPETALFWKNIKCNEFVKSILVHSDWLFDADGTCSINDHRCVPIARSEIKK
jgi:hypothetical protein